ncbi:MAG: class II fructose-bisphosphate aldolase [Candidatus Nanohalarchaeota archaeon]|nr:MAG: class II fructose-bisphosphate aldolase [Candidatus Nanohaloarchaeota archaeon]
MAEYSPISGAKIFEAIKDKDAIIMAANVRYVPGIADGLFRAAKDADSPLIIEIARSECNLERGYIGYTPKEFADAMQKSADKVGFDCWALHADHIGIKKGDDADIEDTKKLVKAQIDAGFTSFAIDASHIFNFDGKTAKEELQGNIDATIKIGNFIKEEMEKKGISSYGLEAEVGEIGRTDIRGFIITTPDEAVTYITELNNAGIYPNALAIANGSTHGNIYKNGRIVEQVSIDIAQTKKIAEALREAGLDARIAQHGITGTPLNMIKEQFPRGDIIKGNVGTFWQNVVFNILKVCEGQLYDKIYNWVIQTYKTEGKSDEEIFGKNAKFALKEFFSELNSLNPNTVKAIEAQAYASALLFFNAFNTIGKAALARE